MKKVSKVYLVEDIESAERSALEVLLVDDNAINRKVEARMLERLGHHVDIACDGGEAVRKVNEKEYDVVLMDIQMPGMDGYEATRMIRSRADGRARIPIIAVTAHTLAADRERCLKEGMNGHLSKPVRQEAFRNALSYIQSHRLKKCESRVDLTE
ncbi:MAG: response regulator [Myxococcales bacterium]|nr:response regulator [Myxococcales bacterium]